MTRTQYATFLVAGHFLGVDVLEVQEVLRFIGESKRGIITRHRELH